MNTEHWTRRRSSWPSRRSLRLLGCLQITRTGRCHFLMPRTSLTCTPSPGVCSQRRSYLSSAQGFVTEGGTRHRWSSRTSFMSRRPPPAPVYVCVHDSVHGLILKAKHHLKIKFKLFARPACFYPSGVFYPLKESVSNHSAVWRLRG